MNKNMQRILLALGLIAAFSMGCKDDTTDPPAGPTYEERIVGIWSALDAGPQLGSDSVTIWFNADGSFHYEEWFTGLDASIISDGDYSANDAGEITFMVTMTDSVADDTTFTWDSGLHGDDDTLHLDHYYGEGSPTPVMYLNVTPPAN